MTADEFVEKAKEQRNRGRLEEALVSARHASALDPQNADAHWQIALCQIALGAIAKAVPALEKVVDLAPWFARGWTKLGLALKETGGNEEAKECFEKAVGLDATEFEALDELAALYEEGKQPHDEIRVLLAIDECQGRELTAYQLNRLGILHYNLKDYYHAIQYYQRYAAKSSGPTAFFNLGLAFSAPEVSQDADAVDAWRRAIARDPSYERAPKSLASIMPKMMALRRQVQAQTQPILDQEQWYRWYINPFELLRLDIDFEWDGIDPGTLRRAKNSLLQEVELEGGRIEWMPGLRLDRSRAISLCDELNDPVRAGHHFWVFGNPALSGFLQRGELDHFLVHESKSVAYFIEHIEDDDNGFGAWLSSPFAKQFDVVLAKAIERKNVAVVECLLDGRRWVEAEDEDKCFESAHRQVDRLLRPLREAAKNSESTKPTLRGIEALLADGGMGEILGLLPLGFYGEQREAATLVRSISIDAYNHHDDADLAKAILKLAEAFALRSPSLQHRIKEDLDTLDERIKVARQDEAHLTLRGVACQITREGARYGERFIPVDEVNMLRWGAIISHSNGTATTTFTCVIGASSGQNIEMEWATTDHDKQQEFFGKLIDASSSYLLPSVASRIQQDLDNRQSVRIGTVVLTNDGVEFWVQGWFSAKWVPCPWSNVTSRIENGDLVIADLTNPKAMARLPLRSVDNAVVLLHLARRKN